MDFHKSREDRRALVKKVATRRTAFFADGGAGFGVYGNPPDRLYSSDPNKCTEFECKHTVDAKIPA